MFDNIASIDIGYSSVKLIKAKRGFRNFEIISASFEEYDLELAVKDYKTAVDNSFRRLIEKTDISECKAIITVSSDKLLLRNIAFPFSDMSKIADAIPYEAEEIIPYSIDSVIYDFQSLPVKSSEGRSVILTATGKNIIAESINNLNEFGIYPDFIGIEANAHLRCYEYFNSVSNENILVLDIGHRKTVVDIISDSSLIFTRTINTGISDIIEFTADTLKISVNDAKGLLRELDLDLSSSDFSAITEKLKEFNISKPKIKRIYDFACGCISKIIEELSLTIKAGSSFNEFIEFGRIIITGGGSNIKGVSRLLADETGIPVVYMPFLPGYLDTDIRSRFSVCLGNLLVFMNYRDESICFLQGEFKSAVSGRTDNVYLLPGVFLAMSIIVFLLNLIITFAQVSRSQSYTDEILRQKYKRYFNTQIVPADPIKEASLLLQKEQKDLNVLKELIGDNEPFIPTLSLITNSFQGAEGFDISKMNFDGKSITIDGEAAKSSDLENFKKNLLDSGEFETVSLNIRDTSKSRTLFTLTIKKKL